MKTAQEVIVVPPAGAAGDLVEAVRALVATVAAPCTVLPEAGEAPEGVPVLCFFEAPAQAVVHAVLAGQAPEAAQAGWRARASALLERHAQQPERVILLEVTAAMADPEALAQALADRLGRPAAQGITQEIASRGTVLQGPVSGALAGLVGLACLRDDPEALALADRLQEAALSLPVQAPSTPMPGALTELRDLVGMQAMGVDLEHQVAAMQDEMVRLDGLLAMAHEDRSRARAAAAAAEARAQDLDTQITRLAAAAPGTAGDTAAGTTDGSAPDRPAPPAAEQAARERLLAAEVLRLAHRSQALRRECQALSEAHAEAEARLRQLQRTLINEGADPEGAANDVRPNVAG